MSDARQQPAAVLQAKQRFGIIGNAPALTAAIERTLRVAPIDLSVLVIGESGSGKEFIPKIIHANSPRKHAKYIAVNCGAIPEGTIDSELFGHEKGSFTGAVASRKGYFEEADGGTIFLDEVAELPLTTQARLLRVLETGEFIKVGSSTVQKTNIRIVAATNVDMERAVEEGRFRQDLYYRLSTVQITIPPLRDRGNDIGLLARKFAGDFAERWHLPPVTFSDDARAAMQRYRWPGNVRQLKNITEQIALFEAGRTVEADAVRQYLPAGSAVLAPAVVSREGDGSSKREREMLLSLILRLQNRVDELEKRLQGEQPKPVTEALVTATDALGYGHRTKIGGAPFKEYYDDVRGDTDNEVVDAPYFSESPESTEPSGAGRPETLEAQERRAIADALERNGGHRKAAADELRISQRTLYRKIKEYGLDQ